jgi:hypothetical protein
MRSGSGMMDANSSKRVIRLELPKHQGWRLEEFNRRTDYGVGGAVI